MTRMAATERLTRENADLRAEVARLAQHSVQLNALGWRLAEAVGDVGPADDTVMTDPAQRTARLERLIAERDELRGAMLAEWNAKRAYGARAEAAEARLAAVERICTEHGAYGQIEVERVLAAVRGDGDRG